MKTENPWIKFLDTLEGDDFVLNEEKLLIKKFNDSSVDKYKIHREIMPAPFLGDVFNSPIVLLTLNPGYDEKEAKKDYYINYRPYWEKMIQHIYPIPDFPLFCLDEEYIKSSDYWEVKLKPLTNIFGRDIVAKNISVIQFFPYHSEKYKDFPKRISKYFLRSQEYNFELVRMAMKRKALIVMLRSKRLWYSAIPELEKDPITNKQYEFLRFTNSKQNPVLSEKNLSGALSEIIEKIKKAAYNIS